MKITDVTEAGRRFCLGAVILAAGLCTRMGRPKLLLPWRDTSVLGHLLRIWASLDVGQIAVVRAANAADIHTELNRLRFAVSDRILNPAPEAGMFSSIQCAARWPSWRPGLTHFGIVLGDQPHLRRKTLGQLLDFAGAHPEKICQPLCGDRRRHPVILPRKMFLKLRDTVAADLKQFLLGEPDLLAGIEMDDPGLDLDLDSPADYERAKAITDSD